MAISGIRKQANFLSRVGDFEGFKLLLDSLPDTAFFIKDLKGRVMLFNRRSCEVNDVHHESEVLGKTDYDLYPKTLADKYTRDDRKVMKTRKPIVNAIELAPNNTNRLVVYSKAPVLDRKRKVIGVAGIYRFVEDITYTPDWYGRFSELVSHIHKNCAAALPLEELAQHIKMSERQLERQFIRVFGINVVEYVLRARINAALGMLENTDRTISDIATAVGFYDHSHFIRTFKRFRGYSPKQYRMRHAASSSQ